MKKFFKFVLATAGIACVLASCQNVLEERNFVMAHNKNTQYAALKVLTNSSSKSRSLDVSEIAYASITVSGHDIKEPDEPHLDFVPVKNGRNDSESEIIIENVPVGKDRIVTVKAFDKDRNELPLHQIRAVTDISATEENDLFVSKSTTAFANVLYGVKGIFNFEELESDGRMDTIRAVVDDSVPPCLFNSEKLIGELQGFSFPYSATKADYTLEPGAVKFDYLLSQTFNVSINDPLSSVLENQNAANGITIENIVPGNWILTITDTSGAILDRNEIQIESGKTLELGHLLHDGIAVLVRTGLKKNSKECSTLYYWALSYPESADSEIRLEKKSYPGTALTQKITVQNPIDEQNGTPDENHASFYLFDFKQAESVKLILNNGTDGDANKYTSDLTAPQKGVYCVHSSGLNPLSKLSEEPTPIEGLEITAEHFKKCFIDDPENKRFVVLFSEKLYGSSPNSVKAEFNKGINDHDGAYRGTHYAMTKHSEGFWYCSVPYADVQQTNQCGQPSYNFKVNDTVVNPPDFVPDGYVYQKFNGSSGAKKFLCLIYSSQDEGEICRRLSQAKKCRSLSDFDLTTKQGKMQIANFRLVPGTNKLYRSFHPYSDDKKDISDTSKKRMKYVAELSEAAGIKADINLSDEKQSTITYTMPQYYQSIIDSASVLYMTDCSYGQCYETSDSDQFANGIKKIVQFVNKTEGPYQIHCRIGTDRTGVVCAVLALLCGATWQDVEDDYCKSIEMGIYEYRGPGAVKYAVQNLLGVTFLEDVPDLQGAIKTKLAQKGLSSAEIDMMVQRLQ